MAVFRKRRVSALVFPCVTSGTVSAFLVAAVLRTHPLYGTRMTIAALLATGIWAGLLAQDCRRIAKGRTGNTLRCPLPAALILAGFLAVWMTWTVWGSGYLTLAPLEQIDNGTQRLDTLFLSSISESFRRSLLPGTLLNNEPAIPYHTFSPLTLEIAARAAGVPAFIAYNTLYPVLFLPAYVLAQIMAVSAAKEYFGGQCEAGIKDLAVLILMNAGFLYGKWLDAHGVWKANNIISESCLTANLLVFLSYGVLFRGMKKTDGKTKKLLLAAVIPASIFLITWSKISAGLLYTVSVMYFLFRTHIREGKYWLLNILYGIILAASLWLFNLMGSGPRSTLLTRYMPLAFQEYCPGPLGIFGHWIILFLMPAAVIGAEILRLRKEPKAFRTGKTVWIEEMLLLAGIAFLPGAVMVIDGGSASYFSCALEVPAVLLLCAHPALQPEKLFRRGENAGKGSGAWIRAAAGALCVLYCAAMCWINKAENPMDFVTGEHASGLSGMLTEIREQYGAHPEEYTVYLDEDNAAAAAFRPGRSRDDMKTFYVFPAMTGIGVINATYVRDGTAYTYLGKAIDQTSNYKGEYTDSDHALTLPEALEKARGMGKKGVLRITADGYELIEIN